MAPVQTKHDVTVEDVREKLTDLLGPGYRVTVMSDTTLKVGRTGVIPARVRITRSNGMTTFKVSTTGLVVSRGIQAVSINPRIRRALKDAYP